MKGRRDFSRVPVNLMDTEDFRRIALSLEGAEESSHMGAPDFRVGGRIFATLASQSQGFGNLMITPEQQAAFVAELPDLFLPVAGGWGRMGITHIRLATATEDVLTGARCVRRGSYGSTRTVAERRRRAPHTWRALPAESARREITRVRRSPIPRPPNAVQTKAIPEPGDPGESRTRRRRHVDRCWSYISIRRDRYSNADSN